MKLIICSKKMKILNFLFQCWRIDLQINNLVKHQNDQNTDYISSELKKFLTQMKSFLTLRLQKLFY